MILSSSLFSEMIMVFLFLVMVFLVCGLLIEIGQKLDYVEFVSVSGGLMLTGRGYRFCIPDHLTCPK
jgi:hypothetical protein